GLYRFPRSLDDVTRAGSRRTGRDRAYERPGAWLRVGELHERPAADLRAARRTRSAAAGYRARAATGPADSEPGSHAHPQCGGDGRLSRWSPRPDAGHQGSSRGAAAEDRAIRAGVTLYGDRGRQRESRRYLPGDRRAAAARLGAHLDDR